MSEPWAIAPISVQKGATEPASAMISRPAEFTELGLR